MIDLGTLTDMVDRHVHAVAAAVRGPLAETAGVLAAAGFAEREIDTFLAERVVQIGAEMVKAQEHIRTAATPYVLMVNDNG